MADRFVILHHRQRDGEHWDLMLEKEGVLLTWQLPAPPSDAAWPMRAVRIADHRLAYLDYQGPVSRDRGVVSRLDAGSLVIEAATDSEICFNLTGKTMSGQYTLTRLPSPKSSSSADTSADVWKLQRSNVMELSARHATLDFRAGPVVMGILNVTPDSFSDGGCYLDLKSAVQRAAVMAEEGASIIDIGGESTRPGSQPVLADEQIARVAPVIRQVRASYPSLLISIDTRLTAVARAALNAGADIVNDVSALQDDDSMADFVARERVPVVLMHKRGTPSDMQASGGPRYDDVVAEVLGFLQDRVRFAMDNGIDRGSIIIDPGLGFGKRLEHNLLLMRHLDRFVATGLPVLIGASRKSFIGSVTGVSDPADRVVGSLACATIAALAGTAIIRAHDVKATAEALRICTAIRACGRQ